MSDNFLYFNYIKPGTRYYEKTENNENKKEYVLELPSEDWEKYEFTNWKFYANKSVQMQEQGWKIHISATKETAIEVLNKVGKVLFEKNVLFKHIGSESFLELMNSKHGNRASAGKFMAIYPTDENFLILLDELHECLKDVEKGPYILSDRSWKDGNVYYRYGGFKRMVTESGELAIRDKEGKLIPDNRTPYYRVPDFVDEPAKLRKECSSDNIEEKKPSKLSLYEIVRALRFNNGGGIYLAKEKKTRSLVVIKEARPKVGYDGNNHDAEFRINNEYAMLCRLADVGGIVKVKDYFKVWENTFLVEEFVEGIDLTHWVSNLYPFHQDKNIDDYLEKVKILIGNLTRIVHKMHQRNIGMGDLQPSNIIIGKDLKVTLIDFEAGQDLYCQNKPAMMTVGFAHIDNQNNMERDWYGIKKILKYCILPIGPVEVLSERNKIQQEIWINKICGKEFYNYYKEMVLKCDSHLNRTKERNFFEGEETIKELEIKSLIQGLREGIQKNYTDRKSLIKGDIRQYEMECGNDNVLVGGFGAILALSRTGTLDKTAQSWIKRFIRRVNKYEDIGLFTGLSGIASVMYENGYKNESICIFDELIKIDISNIVDISIRSGISGLALALCHLYENINEKKYLDKVINMADSIKEYIVSGKEIKVRDWAAVPIGLIDGLSGVSLLFSKLYYLTRKKEYKEFAVELIKYDLEKTYVSKDTGIIQSLDDRMRLLPYLSGGSLGIAVAIWFLNHVCKSKYFETEMKMILNLSKLRCTYSAGLFDGFGSLLLVPAMLPDENERCEIKEELLEKLKMYLIYEEDQRILCPGNFSYRLSEDVFSGSSGIMLALQGVIDLNPLIWMPLIGGVTYAN